MPLADCVGPKAERMINIYYHYRHLPVAVHCGAIGLLDIQYGFTILSPCLAEWLEFEVYKEALMHVFH